MTHDFEFGVRVQVDGEKDLKAIVTGFLYRRGSMPEVELAYWVAGDQKQIWVPAWRVSAW